MLLTDRENAARERATREALAYWQRIFDQQTEGLGIDVAVSFYDVSDVCGDEEWEDGVDIPTYFAEVSARRIIPGLPGQEEGRCVEPLWNGPARNLSTWLHGFSTACWVREKAPKPV